MRDHADINVDPDYIGLDGSPTIVSSVDPIPKAPAEREATMVDPDDARHQDRAGRTHAVRGGD